MDNFTTKTDGVSTQPAAEMNSLFSENKNAVTTSGQSLAVDNFQQARAMSIYTAGSDYYVDSGTANAYVLSAVGTFKSPTSYFDGMRVRFYVGNSNTSTSTVNVNSIGAVAIKKKNATTALVAGDLLEDTYAELVYNASKSCFDLLPASFKIITKVKSSGTTSIPGGNVPTKINFDTVDFDNFSLWNGTSKRIEANKIGWWKINVVSLAQIAPTPGTVYIIIYKNGNGAIRLNQIPGGDDVTLSGSSLVQATAVGDYFEIYGTNSGGSSCNFSGLTFEAEFKTNY